MVRFGFFLLLTVSLVSLAQNLSESVGQSAAVNTIEDTLFNNNNVKKDNAVCGDPTKKDGKCKDLNPIKIAKDINTLATTPEINKEESELLKEYSRRANEIDSRVQEARQKILKSNLPKTEQRRLLKELESEYKNAGTITTLTAREPFVQRLIENGAELSVGKRPGIEVDGKIVPNDKFGGTISDYDFQCNTPAECMKLKTYALDNGLEIRQSGGSFDIVCKPSQCGPNDMVKMTVNEMKSNASLSQLVNNKETYLHVQKPYEGVYSDKPSQGLKVLEHSLKGGTPVNSEQLAYSHKADEAFNTSTKTAHKMLQDAPEFINDSFMEESIKKHNLRNSDSGEFLTATEYKKMLSDAANKQTTKGLLSLDINDMNAFLNVRNDVVNSTVKSVLAQKNDFLDAEEKILNAMEKRYSETPKENWTNQQKALQADVDLRRKNLNEMRGIIDAYEVSPTIQKIANPDKPSNLPKSIEKITNEVVDKVDKVKQIRTDLTNQITHAGRSKTGKVIGGIGAITSAKDMYEMGKAANEFCLNNTDAKKCADFLKEASYGMGIEIAKDFLIGKAIPFYSQLNDSFEAGYFVGEQIEKYAGSILVEDCEEIAGKKVCKQIQAREKYIQNPAEKLFTIYDGTEDQENNNNQTFKYIEKCKQYAELLKEKNITCVKLVSEVRENEMLSTDVAKLAYFDKKLEGLGIVTTPPYDEKPISIDNYQIPMESVGSSMLTENTAEVDSIGNEVNLALDLASQDNQKKCETDWDCIDDLDGDLLIENENAWQIKEQLANQANNQAQSQTNQIISQSKAAGVQRAEDARIAQAAFAEGLQELAIGLQAIQQQSAAREADLQVQREQINIQNSQAISALASQRTLSPTQVLGSSSALTSSELAACNNSPYPITDPYACKEFLTRGGVPQSYSGQNQNSIPVVKESLKKKGTCNDWLSSGANEPEQYTIPLPQSFGGSYKFSYEFYGVKDRARVIYNGSVIHDTQCRSGSDTIGLTAIRGGQVRIIVDPLCDPSDTDTQWRIKLECPVN